MKKSILMLVSFAVLSVVSIFPARAQRFVDVPLGVYPAYLYEIPQGNITMSVDVTKLMISRQSPMIVEFTPKRGVSAVDFGIVLYGPKHRAKRGYYAELLRPEIFGVRDTWANLVELGEFSVAIIHLKGGKAIELLEEYSLLNRSRRRPIISFERQPERGTDGFQGTYKLNERCDVIWRVKDSDSIIIRRECHGTRTENMTHRFKWDRTKGNGKLATVGNYTIEVVARPKDDIRVAPDIQGKSITVLGD